MTELAPEVIKTAAPARKRRRRAPTTGAAEDCFTCRKRKTPCDRRRPYCQQCLDIGKECTGYRTTLTWGVGVASRGKLRGKTLPIANSPNAAGLSRKQAPATMTSPTISATGRTNSTASTTDVKPDTRSPPTGVMSFASAPAPEPQRMLAHSTSPAPAIPMGVTQGPNPNFNYAAAVSFAEELDAQYALVRKHSGGPDYRPLQLQRLQTHLINPFDDGSLSAASTGSVSDFGDFPSSPSEYPHSPADIPFTDPFISSFPETYAPAPVAPQSNAPLSLAIPRSFPGAPVEHMSSSVGSDFSGMDQMSHSPAMSSFYGYGPGTPDSFHNSDVASPGIIPESFDYVFPQPVRNSITSHPIAQREEDAADVRFSISTTAANNLSMPATLRRSLDLSPFRHLSLRTQELLGYYDRMICPFLVAFDGPGNPYRMHILHLAVNSEGLRDAIAALSMTNMRQRRIYDGDGQNALIPASQEEQQCKARSIAKLNSQLANGTMARDDSVLATLLILCLFHVCDSGFSKFKTQLAGVQRLLQMRNSEVRQQTTSQRGFIAWVEMFFTWLDAMNSTVNDRETEVQGDSLDMADLSANLGSLEHLAGCEGRLFKLIARLGRLNLLSQERDVREVRRDPVHVIGGGDKQCTPQPSANSTPRQHASAPPNLDFYNLDGNGWRSPQRPPNSPTPPVATPGTPTSALRSTLQNDAAERGGSNDGRTSPLRKPGDHRHAFWKEWTNIRCRLTSWQFPTTTSAVADNGPQNDVAQLSRAFHAAALLYTERLARPTLPPSSAALQTHVAAALSHIASISKDSCVNKFLLWPLFIAGTECVDMQDRALIRDRIVGVTRESGFSNNMAGLGLLQKMWADDDLEFLGTFPSAAPARHAFRWKTLLDSMPGEYIVV